MAPTLQENDFDRVKRRGRSFSPPGEAGTSGGDRPRPLRMRRSPSRLNRSAGKSRCIPLYTGCPNRRMRSPSHGPT
jgi:hypothetical protein